MNGRGSLQEVVPVIQSQGGDSSGVVGGSGVAGAFSSAGRGQLAGVSRFVDEEFGDQRFKPMTIGGRIVPVPCFHSELDPESLAFREFEFFSRQGQSRIPDDELLAAD